MCGELTVAAGHRIALGRLLVSLIVLVGAVAGCGHDSKDLESIEVNGPGTLGIRLGDGPVVGIVVYFHGSDQDAQVITTSAKHADFFAPLLQAGYAVVSADAGGNAYGNLPSRNDYRDLVKAAEARYGSSVAVYVAESMGALAALALLRDDVGHRVKGLVGITPLMGLPNYIRATTFIADQWGGDVTDAADPLSWPPNTFAGRDIRLYQAASDHVIPRGATATDFQARFGNVAIVEIVECSGDHVDASCYQGEDVLEWLSGEP